MTDRHMYIYTYTNTHTRNTHTHTYIYTYIYVPMFLDLSSQTQFDLTYLLHIISGGVSVFTIGKEMSGRISTLIISTVNVHIQACFNSHANIIICMYTHTHTYVHVSIRVETGSASLTRMIH